MKTPKSSLPARHRILVVDDHPLLREGVVQLINRQSDLVCCGEAGTAAATREAVSTHGPDLVLMDLRLGGNDGFDLIKSLKAEFPDLPVLILSQYGEPLYAERALRSGASGYVTKEQATEEVLGAIRAVLAGEVYLSRSISVRFLQRLVRPATRASGPGVETLTDRELQVFQLIAAGKSLKEIAAELGLSINTADTHRENIKHKLQFHSSSELAQFAEAWIKRLGTAGRENGAPPFI